MKGNRNTQSHSKAAGAQPVKRLDGARAVSPPPPAGTEAPKRPLGRDFRFQIALSPQDIVEVKQWIETWKSAPVAAFRPGRPIRSQPGQGGPHPLPCNYSDSAPPAWALVAINFPDAESGWDHEISHKQAL